MITQNERGGFEIIVYKEKIYLKKNSLNKEIYRMELFLFYYYKVSEQVINFIKLL